LTKIFFKKNKVIFFFCLLYINLFFQKTKG
jgi:hypothetical protein